MSDPTASTTTKPTDTAPASPPPNEPVVSTLGPAVTPDFPAAQGLEALLGTSDAKPVELKTAAPTAPPVPPIKVSADLFLSTLKLLDNVASSMLKVEAEPDEILKELAGAIVPVAEYYAAKGDAGPSLLWGNLGVALLGVVFVKYQKVQERRAAPAASATSSAATEAKHGEGS